MASQATANDKARLFFALWPDAPLRRRLAEQAVACEHTCRGRAVPSANLHLTLAFLGAVANDRRDCLLEAAGRIDLPAFIVRLDRRGFWARPQVVWLGAASVPPALTELVAELQRATAVCGLIPEYRPFRAHVTLRRHARRPPPRVPFEPIPWTVEGFALVRSHTLPEGARYEVLQHWPLATG